MTRTTVLTVPRGNPPPADALDAAVDALTRGRVVGLPTETVYGLAVRADREPSVARLSELVAPSRSPDLPLTVHVGPTRAAELDREWSAESTRGAALPRIVARLRERYWPGPVTLVLRARRESGDFEGLEKLSRGGWTGMRSPAHPAASAVLDAVPFPVVMAGAPTPGGPARTADEIRAAFDADTVPLILDAGPATLEQASTVLAVGPGRFEVLREGIVSSEELRRAAGLSILFVCTGNTCRSPMAEALARGAIRRGLGIDDEARFGFEIASAGVYAGPGAPASENSVLALDDLGLDLSGHRSRPVIDREVLEQDRVYCLTRSHRDALLAMLPPTARDAVELLDPRGRDMADPFGGPLEVYRATRDAIAACIEERVREWV